MREVRKHVQKLLGLTKHQQAELLKDIFAEGFVGADSSPNMVLLARINMALHGDPKARAFRTENSLNSDIFAAESYDLIVTNPPFKKGGIKVSDNPDLIEFYQSDIQNGDPSLATFDNCRFIGRTTEEFSLHAVSVALRASCEVLLHLGVLQHSGDRCWLDPIAAMRTFGPALADDFEWTGTDDEKSAHQWIAILAAELRLDTGFIVASELRTRLRKQGFDNPDREIAMLESEGRVVIEASCAMKTFSCAGQIVRFESVLLLTMSVLWPSQSWLTTFVWMNSL